ncbi:hypothetical protein ACMDCR_20120 [Labrys okinawensis]|uniref:hypothetical protein n=1 Tax=Labrys okinawensis TaxID=346911 RepID=UPI0039BCB1F6
MIPASYFFKNAQCRQWEQPELPEGVPAEVVQSGEQGWLRSLAAAFRGYAIGRQSKESNSCSRQVWTLRG